jgi:type I restriction enzyme, S subunit
MVASEWINVQLKDIAELKYGKSPKDVKVEKSNYPIYGTSGITGFAKKPLFRGPVILVGRKGNIDKPIYINEDCWIIDTAFGLITNGEKVDIKWLYYFLDNYKLDRLNEATGVPSLSKANLDNIQLFLPPKQEQRKIADILSSVDEAIEKTEAIIEQTEKVKKGLMRQLLTKGIGHTKFKKTEIGEIPEEWDIKRLEELSDRIFVGIATSTTEHYCETGIPIIRNQNIKENFLDSNDMMFITEHFDMENRNKKLKPGDILTVRTGYPGTSCVVPDSFEGAQTFTTLVTRPKHSIIDAEFLCRYINSHIGKKYVLGGQVGGAQKNLNVSVMAKLPVPVPPMNEQKKIRDILISFENKILYEKHQLKTLENLKKSLMQSLLTGKVRVKVDDEVMSS